MRDALVAGLSLNIFNKHCDRVKMANIAQLINCCLLYTSNPRALCGAKNSSEAHGQGAEKSRYCVYGTRTVNRHRWMRRES